MALTERRKADRLKMADEIESIVRECGATCVRSDPAPLSPRGIWLEIEGAGGLCVTVDLDGESVQPDIHVVAWHVSGDSDSCLAASFGDVNPHHFRKATHVAYGFEALRQEVRRGLMAARDGSAFDAERQARHIAENGTAVERAARFAEWRKELEAQRVSA